MKLRGLDEELERTYPGRLKDFVGGVFVGGLALGGLWVGDLVYRGCRGVRKEISEIAYRILYETVRGYFRNDFDNKHL